MQHTIRTPHFFPKPESSLRHRLRCSFRSSRHHSPSAIYVDQVPHSRCTCSTFSRKPGISRYSARKHEHFLIQRCAHGDLSETTESRDVEPRRISEFAL